MREEEKNFMPDLETDIRAIRGIGEQRAKSLARLGILTLGDLLHYFPARYEDRTAVRPIAEVLPEESACIRAMVATLPGPPALARASGGPPSSCYHLPGSTSDLSGDTLALQPAPTLLFAPLTGLRTFQGLGSHGSWRHQCLA